MKKHIFYYSFLIFFLWNLLNCSRGENINRVYFTINPEDRKILFPVSLNDSITINLAFDSGWYNEAISLDSSFMATHPYLIPNLPFDTSKMGSAWTDFRVLDRIYNSPQKIKIGNTDLTFRGLHIFNWKKAMQTNDSEGIFNIPQDDTAHVWELNFEYNYLEIHPVEEFKMPEKCFLFPMKDGGIHAFYIQLPLQITCNNGDTLTMNCTYVVDMAMPWDIAIMRPSKEWAFFNKREDAVWTQYMDGYFRHYTANVTLSDFAMDSSRIYTFDHPYSVSCKYLIGQNFLKHFNVFFDMKNRQIGLLPIPNYQRIVNPKGRRFHYSTHKNPEGGYIVKKIANYKENYYKAAGLQEGDEIRAVDNVLYKDITFEQKREFHTRDTLIMDIVRGGKSLKLIVPIDKNEKQED